MDDQVLDALERFLPTPSARRATENTRNPIQSLQISTHALREEGDPPASHIPRHAVISTHALREEGDASPNTTSASLPGFLPTPSARRATGFGLAGNWPVYYFYPRPPRGGRQQMCHKIKAIFWQYLHNWIQPTKKQSVFV